MSALWLLLADGQTSRAVAVSRQVFTGALGTNGIVACIEPKAFKADLEPCASTSALAVYQILRQQGLILRNATVIYRMEDPPKKISGQSAGLAFALCFVVQLLAKKRQTFPPLATTGEISPQGGVLPIQGLGPKIEAALEVLPAGGLLLYPEANAGDVTPQLRHRLAARGIRWVPVGDLYDALKALGISLNRIEEPFRGLSAFRFEDAGVFFGRHSHIEAVCNELQRRAAEGNPSLLLQGPSGSGKSSLVRAGVLPYLQARLAAQQTELRWSLLRPRDLQRITPQGLVQAVLAAWRQGAALGEVGPGPAEPDDADALLRWLGEALGETIPNPPAKQIRFLWVVDQLEELFTLRRANRPAGDLAALAVEAFDDLLCRFLAAGHWLVLTLRDDFLAAYNTTRLNERIGIHGQYFLKPPRPEALAQMVDEPVRLAGCRFETNVAQGNLSDRLKGDAGDSKGILPLLEFTLTQLYRLRDKGTQQLTHAAYDGMGGLEGSIEEKAEACYRDLPPDTQRALPRIIRALVTLGDGDEPRVTARTAAIAQFPAGTFERALIEAFAAPHARLLVREGERVRVSHEALLTRWKRAAGQIEADRQWLPVRQELEGDARRWAAAAFEDRAGLLLPAGLRLEEAKGLRDAWGEDLQSNIRDFIEASVVTERQRQEQEWERQEQERRLLVQKLAAEAQALREAETKRWRTQVFALVASVLLFGAIGAGFWAVHALAQTQQALADKESALKAEKLAKAEEGDQRKFANANLVLANANLAESNHNLGLALHEKGLQAAAQHRPNAMRLYELNALRLTKPDWSARPQTLGKLLVTPVFRQAYASPVMPHHTGAIWSATFSPDGRTLASGSWDRTIRLWEVATGRLLATLEGHKGWVNNVAFSPDGRTLASGSWDRTIRLWEVATGKSMATLEGHPGSVNSVTFSPDGRTLASGSDEGPIRLWEVATGKPLATLEGHKGGVNSVAFSPDGRTLASGSDEGPIRLWEVGTGKPLATLEGHSGGVNSVAFPPDGRTLASGSDDQTIRLWEVATGKLLATLEGHSGWVYSLAFSPDGRTLASGSDDQTIRLWEVATGKPLGPLEGDAVGVVNTVAFSPDGRTLASGSWDTIRLWEVATGKLLAPSAGHWSGVTSVAFSPDGRTLASGSGDQTIRLWEVATGKPLGPLDGHSGGVNTVAFSPDGRTLASGSWRTICLWEVATGNLLASLDGHSGVVVNSVTFSPDGRTLASGSDDQTIRLWEVATGKPLATLEGHSGGVNSVAFSPDGRTLASGSDDQTIRLWEVATGKLLATLEGHSGWVYSLAFSPDGRTLASGSDDQTIRLWEVATGKPLGPLEGDAVGVVNTVAFSPDGRTLASGSDDQTIRLWEVATGKPLATLEGHSGGVNSVAFSPDGRTLASGSGDKTIRLWEVGTGKHLAILKGHSNVVTSIAFSPDGRTLASGSGDKTTRLWEVATGKPLATLEGDSGGAVNSVAFSPDGRTLASGSWDTIRLWEVATSKLLATLEGHPGSVTSVAFSPDGRTLASGSNKGSIRLWEVATGKPLATLEVVTGENFQEMAFVEVFGLSLAFSPDGRTLASGSGDKTIRLWEVATSKLLATLEGHPGSVTSVAFSPDGRTLASGSNEGSIRLWEVATGKPLATLEVVTGENFQEMAFVEVFGLSLAFSPDGRTLASGSGDKTIRLWEVATSKLLATLEGHPGSVTSVAFSPDGRTLASGSGDQTIRLWDTSFLWSPLIAPTKNELVEQERRLGLHREGLDLVPLHPDTYLYGAETATWSADHPYHWLPTAEGGMADAANAMLQLGLIYDRGNDIARAKAWYRKAASAGSAEAK